MFAKIARSMFQQSLFGLVMLAFGVLLGAGVTTLVSAHGGSTSLIHSCVQANSGNLRIVGASEECKKNEQALDWNQQGVQGQTGPKGDPGESAGALESITDLNGLTCTVDAIAGTVQVDVASTGAISLNCVAGNSNPCTNPAGCADLNTDPQNCGTVGNDITNLFPNATATCVNGQASMGNCDPGWYNVNEQASDGCESDGDEDNDGYKADYLGGDDCEDFLPNVNPEMQEIVGNTLDDDCDGQIDEGNLGSITNIAVSPNPISVGSSASLTVTLDSPASSDTHVTLTCTPSAVVSGCTTLTILSGSDTGTTLITGMESGFVEISAQLGASIDSVTLQVQ